MNYSGISPIREKKEVKAPIQITLNIPLAPPDPNDNQLSALSAGKLHPAQCAFHLALTSFLNLVPCEQMRKRKKKAEQATCRP